MDTAQIRADLAHAKELIQSAPVEARAFLAFKAASERPDGQIPPKYRELIALAVALTAPCAYCIDAHVRQAREAGASQAELAEAVFIASALQAGAAVGHGLMAMRLHAQAPQPPA
jgi:AhpD family alkylhydroperoxidase